jgi:hypothetical protein
MTRLLAIDARYYARGSVMLLPDDWNRRVESIEVG